MMACAGSVHGLACPKKPPPITRKQPPTAVTTMDFSPAELSRRRALATGSAAVIATAASLLSPSPSTAATTRTMEGGPPERQALLQAIADGVTDEGVMVDLLSQLEKLDPSQGKGASVTALDGTWELIYSINADAFSPLLNLPPAIRPTSWQLLGADAARQVGSGRVAQVLNFPYIPLSFLLSSGAVPVSERPSTLEIFPPFRFELVWGDRSLRTVDPSLSPKNNSRIQLVQAGSDADFRALNARDAEAQAAGRNMYKQRYLEVSGQPGDLRISEVVSGDPIIVGAIFVHRRL